MDAPAIVPRKPSPIAATRRRPRHCCSANRWPRTEDVDDEASARLLRRQCGATSHAHRSGRRRAPTHVVRAQVGVPRRRPTGARLLLHGRHDPAPSPRHSAAQIAALSRTYGLDVANVFHAGDGNLHPLILFDAGVPANSSVPSTLRRRHPRTLRRGWRHGHRRARRRRREARARCARSSAQERTRGIPCPEARVRSRRAAEPRQGRADARPLRRLWRAARAWRQAAASHLPRF
jgi:hypothetical protein